MRAILIAVSRDISPELAMIFDMDGVLVHSMPAHMESWRQYLQKLGVEVQDLERRMHGKRNPELVRDLLGDDLAEDVVIEHGAAKERLFRELMARADLNECEIPGVLDFLREHRDAPKAIGSNAEPPNIQFIVERYGLRQYFDVIVDGSQVARPKPFPDIYLEAAARLKVKPENCIVFEDSQTGADAGLAAGMRVVAVETTPTEFKGVHLEVQDFRDPRLEAWLQTQHPA
jgi:beta-phosphoglucomutase